MTSFAAAERRWIERLGGLRNTIRQEVIARQLEGRVAAGSSVLDVGCGQGTQALRLAARGCAVTGVDPSADLLARFEGDAAREGLRVEAVAGRIESLGDAVGDRRFDVVAAHGLLMYLPDARAALAALARHVAPAGLLSFTFRNGHALAMRPALRRDWAGALRALDAGTSAYVNELGVAAASHRLDAIEAMLAELGFRIESWFGVRVFNDAVASEMDVPDDAELAALLDAEERAGRIDPYRWMASQLHVLASLAT
jgi:S-adenosylmethionine-dependent methyltransferase